MNMNRCTHYWVFIGDDYEGGYTTHQMCEWCYAVRAYQLTASGATNWTLENEPTNNESNWGFSDGATNQHTV